MCISQAAGDQTNLLMRLDSLLKVRKLERLLISIKNPQLGGGHEETVVDACTAQSDIQCSSCSHNSMRYYSFMTLYYSFMTLCYYSSGIWKCLHPAG